MHPGEPSEFAVPYEPNVTMSDCLEMAGHLIGALFVIKPDGVILVGFPIFQNVIPQDSKWNFFVGQKIKEVLRVCPSDYKAADLITALQNFWQMKVPPGNI